jgi:hypothetical protein
MKIEQSSHLSKDQLAIRIRLGKLLFWHTRVDDLALTEDAFIQAVMARYREHLTLPIIDPNE